ncbi:MAG: hypothetical protein F6K10_24865 [Moorea sp. SIO2B7]|nr:hypothetical protein [Moorena sp. SIO2B7]
MENQNNNNLPNNEESLKTLSRAITLAEGEFSLILAHCNYSQLLQPIVH